MKKGVLNWRIVATIFCIAVLSMGSVQTASAYTVDFELSLPDSIEVGETFSLYLYGTYNGADNVLGGAIDLSYDESLVEVTDVTLKSAHDIGASEGTIDNDNGKVSTIGFATFAGVTATWEYAVIEFEAIDTGTAVFDVADSNDNIYVWVNENYELVDVTSTAASLTITQVPLPGAFWLFCSGLYGLLAIKRKKR